MFLIVIVVKSMKRDKFITKIIPLTKKVYPTVYRLMGNKADTDDIMQEVSIKLWNNRRALDKHPNQLGYIYTIAKNRSLDQLRRRIYMSDINSARVADMTSDIMAKDDASTSLERRERSDIVHRAISNLSEQKREVLTMFDIDDLDYSEIVSITNLKIEHVRVLVSRARQEVREQIGKLKNEI